MEEMEEIFVRGELKQSVVPTILTRIVGRRAGDIWASLIVINIPILDEPTIKSVSPYKACGLPVRIKGN